MDEEEICCQTGVWFGQPIAVEPEEQAEAIVGRSRGCICWVGG